MIPRSILCLSGIAIVTVRSTNLSGSFTVTASVTGLTSGTTTVLTTAGVPVKILSDASPVSIVANGISVSTITARLVDSANNTVVTATNQVQFQVTGNGTWSDSSVGARFITPAGGIVAVVVKSSTQSGSIKVNSDSYGLTGSTSTVTTTHGSARMLFNFIY